jgi:hypothetical protein
MEKEIIQSIGGVIGVLIMLYGSLTNQTNPILFGGFVAVINAIFLNN